MKDLKEASNACDALTSALAGVAAIVMQEQSTGRAMAQQRRDDELARRDRAIARLASALLLPGLWLSFLGSNVFPTTVLGVQLQSSTAIWITIGVALGLASIGWFVIPRALAPKAEKEKTMSSRLPFGAFLEVVRRGSDSAKLVPESSAGDFIQVPPTDDSVFVAPDFELDDAEVDTTARVLLISAPAAVGKSSLAAQLGSLTGNLVWDLSRFSVGSSFFTGTLVDAFGVDGLDRVRRGLRDGSLTLILDAADEALVRAGSSNFKAAIDNLVSLISLDAQSGPSAIILGRPDTIDDTLAILESKGVNTQVARVAFFNEDQAREFVRAKARRKDRVGIAETELQDFLTQFFDIVGEAVGEDRWNSSESFLGYAPVLDALGAFYREQENPLKRLSEIRAGGSSGHVWDLLIEVIESILDRESEKFGRSFGGGDARKSDFGERAYSRQSQLTLLLSDVPDEAEVTPPDFPDAEEAWIFEEMMPQMRAQYREHPFIQSTEDEPNPLLRFASAAFRDYALAASIGSAREDHSAQLLDYWLDSRVTPSPIFARFCMSERLDLDRVPLDAVTMILDSHASGFRSGMRLELEISDDDEGASCVDVALFEGNRQQRVLRADMGDGEPLRLARSVARTSIDAPDTTVIIGSGSQDFALGPDVSINCRQLSAESTEVRVRVGKDGTNDLRTLRITGSTRQVSAPTSQSLRIAVPSAVFPWQAYREVADNADVILDGDLHWAGMDVRRNIKWFARESMVAGGLNYPVSAMETILGKGRASSRVHDFFFERGYIVKKQNYWELRLPGFNVLTALSNNLDDASYRAFVEDYSRWERS